MDSTLNVQKLVLVLPNKYLFVLYGTPGRIKGPGSQHDVSWPAARMDAASSAQLATSDTLCWRKDWFERKWISHLIKPEIEVE